ncbi:MAG TPA: hypothetical protein P5567_12325 [Kiritimatiellia bacterium]|nr:hypothetical protein [Kiritimatiellia bacterium]HRZ13227.1 hypothetical protein [Kiritimatiellia bacterium]HSA18676.1 hypothetical protein [Kiritimatiellia bacterium]
MRELALLLGKDWRVARHRRRLWSEQSRFKIVFVILFAVGLLGGLWALFLHGFRFLESLGGIGLMLVYRLFYLFFFGLGLMLLLSSVVTTYTTFFRSEETGYLLLKPVPPGTLTLYKAIQSAFYTSWAFFFMIVPFIGAFAMHERLPLRFLAWLVLYSIPFVLLYSLLGTLACLLALPVFRRFRAARWAVPVAAALAAGAWLLKTWPLPGDSSLSPTLTRLVPAMQWASHPLWPSWWMAEGGLALARGKWTDVAMLWGVLASNVLLAGLLVEAAGRRFLLPDWQGAHFAAGHRRRRGVLLPSLDRWLGFLPRDIRTLMIKDARLFLRDPAQWSQALLFFGLLALYFLNLRTLHYHVLPAAWRNLIAFLNIFSVCSIMASLGSRFVYPQLSLEGHSFWILGLAPTTMGRVLAAKFMASVFGLGAVSLLLMTLSTWMLSVPAAVRVIALLVALAMTLVVSALSTGLGAVFIDLKQRNPSAIVSGFGGTLNLVLNLGFMLAGILPLGLVFHLRAQPGTDPGGWTAALAAALAWLLLLAGLLAAGALYAGWNSLRRREFG